MKIVISSAIVGIILILGFTMPQSRARVKAPVFSKEDTLLVSELKHPDAKLVKELYTLKKNVSSFEKLVDNVKHDTIVSIKDTTISPKDSVKRKGWIKRTIDKLKKK